MLFSNLTFLFFSTLATFLLRVHSICPRLVKYKIGKEFYLNVCWSFAIGLKFVLVSLPYLDGGGAGASFKKVSSDRNTESAPTQNVPRKVHWVC